MVGQPLGDTAIEGGNLAAVGGDRLTQALEPTRVAHRQVQGVELRGAAQPEHVDSRRQNAVLAHHRVHLRLQPAAQTDQLGPIADQLSQLTHLRRGDPGLGQTTQPQQVHQIIGVALIVFTRCLPQSLPNGWAKCTCAPISCETSAAQYQPKVASRTTSGSGPSRRHRLHQGHRLIGDVRLRQDLASRVLADDHRPAATQINTDILSFHGNLFSS